MINNCKSCGKELPDSEMKYCAYCGTPVHHEKNVIPSLTKWRILFVAVSLIVVVGALTLPKLLDEGMSEVIEATGMTKEEIEEAYDEAEALLNDEEYLEAMYEFERISGYKDAEDKANLAYEKYCSDILTAAEKLAESENYTEAINVLVDALNEYGEEEQFINYGLEIRETYVNKVFAMADSYVEANDFEPAYSMLESLIDAVDDDGTIASKIVEIQGLETAYHKNNLLTVISDFDNSDEKSFDTYKDIIGEIEEYLEFVENDPEIAGILTKYKNDYCDLVLSTAADYFEKDGYGYEAAIRVIKRNGLDVLPDNEKLTTALAKYEEYIPVSAQELVIIGRNALDHGTFNDSLKNEYKNAYELGGNSPGNNNNYVEFFVGKKYDFISGVYAPSDNRFYDTCQLHIYVDDVLVWSSKEITKKTFATSFSVDISNSDYIKIQLDPHCMWETVIISDLTVYKE